MRSFVVALFTVLVFTTTNVLADQKTLDAILASDADVSEEIMVMILEAESEEEIALAIAQAISEADNPIQVQAIVLAAIRANPEFAVSIVATAQVAAPALAAEIADTAQLGMESAERMASTLASLATTTPVFTTSIVKSSQGGGSRTVDFSTPYDYTDLCGGSMCADYFNGTEVCGGIACRVFYPNGYQDYLDRQAALAEEAATTTTGSVPPSPSGGGSAS